MVCDFRYCVLLYTSRLFWVFWVVELLEKVNYSLTSWLQWFCWLQSRILVPDLSCLLSTSGSIMIIKSSTHINVVICGTRLLLSYPCFSYAVWVNIDRSLKTYFWCLGLIFINMVEYRFMVSEVLKKWRNLTGTTALIQMWVWQISIWTTQLNDDTVLSCWVIVGFRHV